MEKIVYFDGHSVLNRAFYGISNLSTTDGFPTNAIYGFLAIMFKTMEDEKPDYLAVAFDVHEPTFRHKMYDAYKGTRKKMPDELHLQVPKMKEVLSAMGIPIFEQGGFEADDIIGTLAKKSQADGFEVIIVSGDRDLLQLVDEHITVKLAKPVRGNSGTEDYNIEKVIEKYGLRPSQIIDLKGLMGDSSDNIPGLPGVGEKTATAILKEFATIENAYENINKITPPKAKRAFEEHFDMAVLSKKLATICTDAPVVPDYESLKCVDYFNDKSYQMFKDLEFKRFLDRFDEKDTKVEEIPAYSEKNTEELIRLIEDHAAKQSGVSVRDGMLALCLDSQIYIASESEGIKKILSVLFDKSEIIASFSCKEIIKAMNIRVFDGKLFDAGIAAYLLNPIKNSYFHDDIARDYLKVNIKSSAELLDKKLITQSDEMKNDSLKKLISSEAYVAFASKNILEDELKKLNMLKLFYEVEMPLCVSLKCMEQKGILIKPEELSHYSSFLSEKLDILQKEIYEAAGEEFNINSPKQLGDILFVKLKLPASKKTKSGYSTSVDVLEKLKNDYKIVDDVLVYRQFSKFKSTYSDALPKFAAEDGRIHSDFLQTVTATGRISSANPNLQNIPIRTELGRSIRKVFVPAPGCVFIDADYSQIELRVLAHMSGDEGLINAFYEGEDIHRATAAKVFNIPIEEVTAEQRRNAKAVNFGIVYGISAYGLSQDLNIPVKEAKAYIDQYFATYPKVQVFIKNIVESTRRSGYSYTIFNRRRPVPEINASNAIQRSFGERIAMNSPVQGSAADIMKIAMNAVHKELETRGLKASIVLQVHDELLIEAPVSEADEVSAILKEKMEGACKLAVPLLVDIQKGSSWYETK